MAPEKGSLIARSDFPMYLISSLGERHFLVAGGGGAAKSGITNNIEIYEVKKVGDSLIAGSVCRHDVGSQAPMNGMTVYDGRNHLFAAGLDDECHLFSLKYKVVTPVKKVPKKEKSGTDAVKRKGKKEAADEPEEKREEESDDLQNQNKQLTFNVEEIKSVRTDFHGDSSFQKVVRFSPDHSILATGGADGHLRVWNTKDLTKLYDISAHKDEIVDLDVCPKGDKIVTLSRGSCFSVWNTKDGKKHLDMEWPGKAGEHRFRACRFGLIEGSLKKGFNLYTVNIPVRHQSKPNPCFICKWDGTSYKPKLVQDAGTEVISSMTVSPDGIYVGVGMMTGSVAVYISFSLQKLYYVKECHNIFVTGVDFMPISESQRALSSNQDFTLLSISADNTVRVHQEPKRRGYSVIILCLGVALMLILIFWFMSELGL